MTALSSPSQFRGGTNSGRGSSFRRSGPQESAIGTSTRTASSPSVRSSASSRYSRPGAGFTSSRSWTKFPRARSSRPSSSSAHSTSSRYSRSGWSRFRSRKPSQPVRQSWLDIEEPPEETETVVGNQTTSNAASSTTLRESEPAVSETHPSGEHSIRAEVIMAATLKPKGTVGCAYYSELEQKLYLMRDTALGDLDYIELLTESINPTMVLLSAQSEDSLVSKLDPNRSFESSNPEYRPSGFQRTYTVAVRPSHEFSYEKARESILGLNLDGERIPTRQPQRRDGNSAPGDSPEVSFFVPGELSRWSFGDQLRNGNFSENAPNGFHETLDESFMETKPRNASLQLAHLFETENATSITCAGAILQYLMSQRQATMLSSDPDIVMFLPVREIQLFTLSDAVFINSDTIQSLQIMNTETNPHFHNQGPTKSTSKEKEGLSVYGLFSQFVRTPQGKVLLKQYFLRPTLNLEILNERLDSVSVFTASSNLSTTKELSARLKNVQNMRSVLVNLQKGASSAGIATASMKRSVWNSLRDFCFNMLDVIDFLGIIELPLGVSSLPIITLIRTAFNKAEIASIGHQIENVIDFESSKEAQHTTVKSGVDGRLDQLRLVYNGLDPLLIEMRLNWIARLQGNFVYDQLDIVYLPRIGFRMRVSFGPGVEPEEELHGIDPNGPWVMQFKADPYAFYVNHDTEELDARLGDVSVEMSDREVEIVHALGQEVLRHESMLTQASDACGELDVRLALAKGALTYNLVRPDVLETENVIDIQEGRHILQELTVPAFVSNPTRIRGGEGSSYGHSSDYGGDSGRATSSSSAHFDELEDDFPAPGDQPASVLVMTGPNLSGKSVYLKQIGIIVYLAHIGSFVPAKAATIGTTTHILTRISTRESVSKLQSSFLIDLQQISLLLKHASRRSLLLIDEFGKGTDSVDGAGLFGGLLKHLLKMGDECPKTVVSTHFHELFETDGLLDLTREEKRRLGFGYMEVQMQSSRRAHGRGVSTAREEGEEVGYLYNFRPGRSNMSLGIQCARLHGVPSEVVARADALNRILLSGQDLVSACARTSDDALGSAEERQLKHAEKVARRFLKTKWEDLDPNQVRQKLEEILT